MARKKIDVSKIKERKVEESEIEENEKVTKKNTWLLFRVPVILDVILAIIYIPTANNILLIPIGIIFVLILYGMDCHQRICENCKKWNSTVVLKSEGFLRTSRVNEKNLFNKNKIKEKKNIVNKTQVKCLNCGYETKKEIIK